MQESIDNSGTDIIKIIEYENLIDLCINFSEPYVDELLDNGLKEIPILDSLFKIVKLGRKISICFFYKKIYTFLTNIQNIPFEKRNNFISAMEKPKFKQKVGDALIFLIDRFDHVEKSVLLSNLFLARVENKIDITHFLRLASIIEKAFLPDLCNLEEYKKSKSYKGNECECDSLRSLGLIYQSVIDANGEGDEFSLTQLGKDIIDYALRKCV